MKVINYRRIQIVLTLISLLVLTCSLCFQYIQDMEPCPLCLMQRLAVFLVFILSMLGIFIKTHPSKRRLGIAIFCIALAGLYFAARQVWLQSLPPGQAPACMPGMDVLIQYFPWKDILHALILGDGDCAEVRWTWLGLSMPVWAGLYFIFVMITTLVTTRVRE